jgi:hypothetical protein
MTGDYTGYFSFIPQPKCKSCDWKYKSSWKQKFLLNKSTGGNMLEVFFDVLDLVHYDFIPASCTANKEMLVTLPFPRRFSEKETCRKWAHYSWFPFHCSALGRQLLVRMHFAKHNIMALEHPPCCLDFLLFLGLKKCFESTLIQECLTGHCKCVVNSDRDIKKWLPAMLPKSL